ncbi:hypothetical protein SRIMM317S_06876 [Streptomyces rimosus subsp. rimosus]
MRRDSPPDGPDGSGGASGGSGGPSPRWSAREAVAVVTEDFTEFPAPEAEDAAPPTSAPEADDGPLGWDGYGAARQRARERTGERESVISGTARIDGVPTVLISFEFGFLGGSSGSAPATGWWPPTPAPVSCACRSCR